MADTLVNHEDTTEPANEEVKEGLMTEDRLQSKDEERSIGREAKEGVMEEKLAAGSLSWLLGLGLSLLPSNHLDLSPRWQQWFLRFLIFWFCEINNKRLSGASRVFS